MFGIGMKLELVNSREQLSMHHRLSGILCMGGWTISSKFPNQSSKWIIRLLIGPPRKAHRKNRKYLEVPRTALGEFVVRKPQVYSSKGLKEVFHLEVGILKHLEEVHRTKRLWEGKCTVFDKPVSVELGMTQGTDKLFMGASNFVSDADMVAPEWEYGVSCPHCYSSKSAEEKERSRARQMQFENWGVIGGPDKGRPPTRTTDAVQGNLIQLLNSA